MRAKICLLNAFCTYKVLCAWMCMNDQENISIPLSIHSDKILSIDAH